MIEGSAAQVAINYILPKPLRDPTRVWDKKTVESIFTELAEKYPDRFKEIVDNLFQLSRLGATYSTGFTFGLEDLKPHPLLKKFRQEAYNLVSTYLADRGYNVQDEKLAERISELVDSYMKHVLDDLEKVKNPAYIIYKSGVRGSEPTIRRLKFTEGVYQDSWGRLIPYPVVHNFPDGLTASEYWASAYGSKQGIVTTKLAPGKAGFIYKQLVQAVHDLIVARHSGPSVGIKRGLVVDVDDDDNVGAILAEAAGGFPEGTKVTPEVLTKLKARNVKKILIHSPVAGGPKEGIYAVQAGYRGAKLPGPGDPVGIEAAQAIGERVSQAVVGKKHLGVIRGSGFSATETLEKLISVPEHFPGAAHATVEGKVEKIEPHPAGGYFLYISGHRHYIPPDVELKVKPGDYVEAGDILTTGLPNPAAIVRGKGIGEGRRYFVKIFTNTLRELNFPVHRRNVEVLARGLINLVEVTKPFGDFLPGDLVKYNYLEFEWKPREGSKKKHIKDAIGNYLEVPVLHYTIGTKVTRSMVKELEEFGINEITVHEEPPPFEPIMVRALDIITKDPDWLVRLLGAYQKRSLLEALAYGGVSKKYKTPSFVPSLAEGVHFGEKWPKEFLSNQ